MSCEFLFSVVVPWGQGASVLSSGEPPALGRSAGSLRGNAGWRPRGLVLYFRLPFHWPFLWPFHFLFPWHLVGSQKCLLTVSDGKASAQGHLPAVGTLGDPPGSRPLASRFLLPFFFFSLCVLKKQDRAGRWRELLIGSRWGGGWVTRAVMNQCSGGSVSSDSVRQTPGFRWGRDLAL